MALPSSGAISLNNVNVELGRTGTTQVSLNDGIVRTLFAKSSGSISMSDGYGKANEFAFAIASNQTNADLRTLAFNAGWNGTTKVIATINSGVFISSASTGSYALTISGSFPNGATLVNNGTIVGRGGSGGNGALGSSGCNCYSFVRGGGTGGSSAGPALFVSTAITINNQNRIAGGGGGGGGGGNLGSFTSTGGGGGGGVGNGPKGFKGQDCGNVQDGQDGSLSAAGAGGLGNRNQGGSGCGDIRDNGGDGGAGGAFGSAGAAGTGNSGSSGLGGSGGAAVVGNGNITWIATGTRNGSIS